MLLGYHTNGLQNHRLDEGLQLLSEHGYRAVAITPDTCHIDPSRTEDAALDALGGRLAALGLKPVMETGARYLLDPTAKHEPTLMTTESDGVARRVAFYGRVAQMGRRLGAEVVSFWAGIDRSPGHDSWSRLLRGVAAACTAIRAHGLRPSFEPEPGMALETVSQYERLRDELGDDAPELTLDVGHLYAAWEGDPVDVIARAAPFLAQVHLEDHRRGVHEHLLPGDGEVDFTAVLSALQKASYFGPVCWEMSRHSHCAPEVVRRCRAAWTGSGGPV